MEERNSLSKNKKNLVIYHNSCPDGFAAAVVAHKKYPEAELVGKDHGSPTPYGLVKDKDVLVVDFSWRTTEENVRLSELARSFHILDHHKTAQATLEGLPFARFDMNRSGAGLTWDYLFGADSSLMCHPTGLFIGTHNFVCLPRPWWVDYVEDRDLWRNDGKGDLPDSNEINAFIMTLPHTLEAWSELDDMTPDCCLLRGTGAQAHVEHYVREAVKQARRGHLQFQGRPYSALVVNALYMNISEVAHELVKMGADIGVGFFERNDNVMQFSLRSQGDTDVSAIAKSLGGGGHRNAAGFQLSIEDGRRLVDSVTYRDFDAITPVTPDGLKAILD